MKTLEPNAFRLVSSLLSAVLVGLVGCDLPSTSTPPAEDPPPSAASLTIGGGALTLRTAGERTNLTALYTHPDGRVEDVTRITNWTSSDSAVARIDSPGVVRAMSSGSATVRAWHGDATAGRSVRVEIVRAAGRLTVPERRSVDLDNGMLGFAFLDADIRFATESTRSLTPANGSRITRVGTQAPGFGGCHGTRLSESPINVSTLREGDYLCVETNRRRLAEVRIVRVPLLLLSTSLAIDFRTFE